MLHLGRAAGDVPHVLPQARVDPPQPAPGAARERAGASLEPARPPVGAPPHDGARERREVVGGIAEQGLPPPPRGVARQWRARRRRPLPPPAPAPRRPPPRGRIAPRFAEAVTARALGSPSPCCR